jgi:GNAT superfamily N-acetyltransferase
MTYTVVNPENAAELETIPEDMLDVLNHQGGFCIIADEDEEMHGIAVFSLDAPDGEVRLEYIAVPSEYRRQGVAAGMLSFASDMLRESKTEKIVCSVSGKIEYISEMIPFMKALDFQVTVPFDQAVEYRLRTILDNKKFHPLFEKMPECIKSEDEILSAKFRQFQGELAAAGIIVKGDDYDRKLSRYYVKDGEVKACMLVREEPDTFDMRLFHAAEGVNDPIAFPGMLAACADAAFEKGHEDRIFRLYLRSTELKDRLAEILGRPEFDFIVQEYEKTLAANA